MKNLINILFFATVFTFQISAQIQPPDFLCVRGDTLFWNPAVNNCGPFEGYEIWGSQSQGGPFVLLGTVTDPAQDFYFNANPNGEQWFFYLLSDFDCPSQTAIPSDTLDNRPPEISPIQSLSVDDGNVLVTWEPSPSPEVNAYIIYRETPIGVVPIDTVFSGNTYLDTAADPDLQPESYFVNALDPCGNTSIFDAKHTTVFLEGTLNPCRQSVGLTWNQYDSWPNGVGEQQIWAGVNGATLTLAQTIDASVSTFEFQNLNDGDTYCIALQAVEASTGEVSRSNEICLTADITQAVRDFFIKNVSVTPANEVEVTWGWNTNAEIKEIQVLSSSQNTDFQLVETLNPQLPLPAEFTYLDENAGPDLGSIFYKIQTRDDCDSLAQSTYGSTIFLSGSSLPGNINQLNWTPLDIENAAVEKYEIFKIVGGSEANAGSTTSSVTTFEDSFDPTNLAEAQACYYVVAHFALTAPNGSELSLQSRSNTFCVEQEARILAPNAFAPDGFNQEFKPLIVLGDLTSYELRIFDRYGQEVFFSKNPDDGWDGRKGGKNLPQGAYVYQIQITQSSGRRAEKRGMVLLLR